MAFLNRSFLALCALFLFTGVSQAEPVHSLLLAPALLGARPTEVKPGWRYIDQDEKASFVAKEQARQAEFDKQISERPELLKNGLERLQDMVRNYGQQETYSVVCVETKSSGAGDTLYRRFSAKVSLSISKSVAEGPNPKFIVTDLSTGKEEEPIKNLEIMKVNDVRANGLKHFLSASAYSKDRKSGEWPSLSIQAIGLDGDMSFRVLTNELSLICY